MQFDTFNATCEAERKPLAVAGVHRRSRVLSDIQALKSEPPRHLLPDPALTHEVTIVKQAHKRRSARRLWGFALELHTEYYPSAGQRRMSDDIVALQRKPVVVIAKSVVQDEKTPAGGVSSDAYKDPFCALPRDFGNDVNGVIDVDRPGGAPFRQAPHPGKERDLVAAGKKAGAQCAVHSLREPVVEWEHVISSRFNKKALLQLAQLFRMAGREIFGLAEVFLDVIELPAIVGKVRGPPGYPGQPSMAATGNPSLIVNGSIAKHFEILDGACAVRVRLIKAVGHADALDWPLGNTVHDCRLSDTNHFEDCGQHVNHVMELEACGTGIGNASRPTDDQCVSGCAEVGRNLLDPLERCIAGPRPPHGEVRAGS